MLGLPVSDATSGFRAYGAGALRRIDLASVRADGYGFQIEMAYRVASDGGRIVELPIQFVDRQRGTSKMSSRIIVEALVLVTWWGVRDRLLHRGSPAPESAPVPARSRRHLHLHLHPVVRQRTGAAKSGTRVA